MKKYRILAAVCLVLALGCAAVGIYKYNEEMHAGEGYDEMRREAGQTESETFLQTVKEVSTGDLHTEKEPVVIPIDFELLQEKNPDIYAWIQIPGTTVDYPVVQHSTDNSYYLNHSADKAARPEGAIFTEDYNTKTFEDPNTVIYGHRMTNDSMFNSLKNYTDRSFFDEHRKITIYMPDRILNYKIFAAYLYDNRHLMQSYDFWDTKIFDSYLKSIFALRSMDAFVDTSMTVTGEDKIITLSTCKAGEHDKRYLVQAVLVSIEE